MIVSPPPHRHPSGDAATGAKDPTAGLRARCAHLHHGRRSIQPACHYRVKRKNHYRPSPRLSNFCASETETKRCRLSDYTPNTYSTTAWSIGRFRQTGGNGLLCTSSLLNGRFGQGKELHLSFWESVKVVDKVEEEGDTPGAMVIRERERFSQRLTLLYSDGRFALLSEKADPKEGGDAKTRTSGWGR